LVPTRRGKTGRTKVKIGNSAAAPIGTLIQKFRRESRFCTSRRRRSPKRWPAEQAHRSGRQGLAVLGRREGVQLHRLRQRE
jgi:hypothetical protein